MSQKLGLIKNVYIWKEKSKIFSYLAASVSTAKMTEINWIYFFFSNEAGSETSRVVCWYILG